MNINNITKEQFNSACNEYPPSKWIYYAYKYFSDTTEVKDMKLKIWINNALLITFTLLFVGVVFELPRIFILIPSYIYMFTLIPLVAYLFSAVFLNNLRIKKICKKLGITVKEYGELSSRFY